VREVLETYVAGLERSGKALDVSADGRIRGSGRSAGGE